MPFVNFSNSICRVILLLTMIALSACGGGSGSTSSNPGSHSSDSTENEALSEEIIWQDAGTFGDDVIVLLDSSVKDQEEIYRIDINYGTQTKLSRDMKAGGKVARMSISPDGKKMAYLADQDRADKYELYLANADGSQNIRILKEGYAGEITSYTWSPDSRYIEYKWENEIYILDLDTFAVKKEPTALLRQWSSDSRKLARLIMNSDESYTIQIVDVENDFSVLSESTILGYKIDSRISLSGDTLWNGDLSKMFFQTEEDFSENTSSINVIDLTTDELTTVIEGKYLRAPSWSPNGTDISYWGIHPLTDAIQLFVFDTASKNTLQITNLPKRQSSTIGFIFWENEGRDMYFTSDSPNNDQKDLFKADNQGDEIVGLMNSAGIDLAVDSFVLAPKARYIVMRTRDPYNNSHNAYYIYDSDRKSFTEISDLLGTTNYIRDMAWTPSADYFIYRDFEHSYKMNINTFSSEQIELPDSTTKKTICLLVAASNKNYCNQFFDYR